MAILNGYDLDTLKAIAEGYDILEGNRLGLKQKEDISPEILETAKKALDTLMPNRINYNLNKTVEPKHSGYRDQMENIVDAIYFLNTSDSTQNTNTNEAGPQERIANLIGPAYTKYNAHIENGQLVLEGAPADEIMEVYARLRANGYGLTLATDKNGNLIGFRPLGADEKPAEIQEVENVLGIEGRLDITQKGPAMISRGATENDTVSKVEDEGTETDLAIIPQADVKQNKNAPGLEDEVYANRLNRLTSDDGLVRLAKTATQLNEKFKIQNGQLIAKDGVTVDEITEADDTLGYFYPTELVMNEEGRLVGLAPIQGYEEFANIVYETMSNVRPVQNFADKYELAPYNAENAAMNIKNAPQTAKGLEEPKAKINGFSFADYVTEYLNAERDNNSDENEVFYNALRYATLASLQPQEDLDEIRKEAEAKGLSVPKITYDMFFADYATHTDRVNALDGMIEELDPELATAYAEALNDSRMAMLDVLPPKKLVEFEAQLQADLEQPDLTDEAREGLASKLNALHGRMDEMINDYADDKIIFDKDHALQLGEVYEGFKAVIESRMEANKNAPKANEILEQDIAAYDNLHGLTGLTPNDAERLNDRAMQVEDAFEKMGITQFLGHKLKNAVSSQKASTERNFEISDETKVLLEGLSFTDENGNIAENKQEALFMLEDIAMAEAYKQAILGDEKITRESLREATEQYIQTAVTTLIKNDMVAKGLDISGFEEKIAGLSAENPYKLSTEALSGYAAGYVQSNVGVLDRLGNKIGRDATVLRRMHHQTAHLDKMAHDRFGAEYVKSNRMVNTLKKTATSVIMSGAMGAAFWAGGAPIAIGIVSAMTATRLMAGYYRQKKEARQNGTAAQGFGSYLWSEKTQIAMTAGSLAAMATGLAWAGYAIGGVNIIKNFRSNAKRDKQEGQDITIKDGVMGGIETALPTGASVLMNIAMGGLFQDAGNPDNTMMDNVQDAWGGLKDIFGFGDAAVPDAPATTETGASTEPVNATTVKTPVDLGIPSDTTAGTDDPSGQTLVKDIETSGTAGAPTGTSDTGTTGTTDSATGSIPNAEIVHHRHVYDDSAHAHADARIHGEGLSSSYKLDYNEAQLDSALNTIRGMGETNPELTSSTGQSNAEILMYKLNQVDQLLAPDTDINTPNGRMEAQEFYGHKNPDGTFYGPHDLRADLLAGKAVDPDIASEIFGKMEQNIDAKGHHIGDLNNFKEEGTWSYRKEGIAGFDQQEVPPTPTPNPDLKPTPMPTPVPTPTPVATPVEAPTPTPVAAPISGVPFVPYIPYDKPYMSKIRTVLKERIGAWMSPIKSVLGIKEDKQALEQDSLQKRDEITPHVMPMGMSHDKSADKYEITPHVMPMGQNQQSGMGVAEDKMPNGQTQAPYQAEQATSNAQTQMPGYKGLAKHLVPQESDLPQDPKFKFTPTSPNFEADVNGAFVADFRENTPKINRTLRTSNADYVMGNTQKEETDVLGLPEPRKGLPEPREGLPEPRKGLPEAKNVIHLGTEQVSDKVIRLGTEQVSDKTIYLSTQEQKADFNRNVYEGVPPHIRKVLEEKAKNAKKPTPLLEDKEGKTTVAMEKDLIEKHRSADVDTKTANTSNDMDFHLKTRQKQPTTQTGTGKNTVANNSAVWKHLSAKKGGKQP